MCAHTFFSEKIKEKIIRAENSGKLNGPFIPFIFGSLIFLSLFVLAIYRGENISAAWILVLALSSYFVGYRYYSRFIANRVFKLDSSNPTPAHIFNNGYDFVPTNKYVVFGHHFAAISGAGPLVGPVLAAQMGYLPATLWIIFGVVLAGAVQDMVILIISTRSKAKSLGEIASEQLGKFAGTLVLLGIYSILTILMAVLALVVVKAMFESPWGVFTIFMTIPIAMIMGVWMWKIKPGDVALPSLFGFLALIASLIAGRFVALHPELSKFFSLSEKQIAIFLILYGASASVLPVWLLLAPRDYLSTFLKIGTVVILAVGIFLAIPEIKMPAITQFINGDGPVWKGDLVPFLFITIACGAISGFHSLVSSGTTPKLLDKETDARFVGYTGMLMESFVAVMALIAAVTMEPGIYFAINSPQSEIGKTVASAVEKIRTWGFYITAEDIENLARAIEEKTILSRTGGAPSLAIGMALIFSKVFGEHLVAFFYHFIILFEALFILTTIDAGTRIGRFIFQDLAGRLIPKLGDYNSLFSSFIATFVTVSLWGYFLYAGVVDPYGGIKTFWPIFGIANQLLASMALIIATTYLINNGKLKYAFITAIPMIFVVFNTSFGALQKIFHSDPKIGFLAHASYLKEALLKGQLPANIPSPDVAQRVIFGDYLNVFVLSLYLVIVSFVFITAISRWGKVISERKNNNKSV
jgi:carbon starvation protein